jgi:hypothetical protein
MIIELGELVLLSAIAFGLVLGLLAIFLPLIVSRRQYRTSLSELLDEFSRSLRGAHIEASRKQHN